MLTRFFATADHDIERLSAWVQRLGPGGAIIWVLMASGVYSIADCALFVLRH